MSKTRMLYRIGALTAFMLATACADAPMAPEAAREGPALSSAPVVYTSGSHVDSWNAIVPVQDANWFTNVCVPTPAIGLNDPRWVNPHKAFVANGASFQWDVRHIFTADWINAWPGFEWFGLTAAWGGPPGSRGQSWTKYSTPVSGTGDFVLYLAADNCSWIYLTNEDGSNPRLVGVQLGAPWVVNIKYPVTLTGNHRLVFMVYDGGGQSGGMFKLETNSGTIVFTDTDGDGLADVSETNIHKTSPTNPDTDGDGISDGDEVAAGTNPLVPDVVDTDGDGVNDDVDNCPAVANADQANFDGDAQGDVCDADDDNDGVSDASDAFPKNGSESADTDGDGIGNNADAYDSSDTRAQLHIGTCNTGVANKHLGNGTWWSDLIAAARASAANHGKFVSAVADLADGWKKAGQISGAEQGAIVSCAARSK